MDPILNESGQLSGPWRPNGENTIHPKGLKAVWLHQKATTFNGVGTTTNRLKTEVAMAVKLEESRLILPGWVPTHKILEKSHLLLLCQACQAKLGMVKRVRDGSISLGDDGGQKLDVFRLARTGLFMIRIDHTTFQDFSTNPVLNDLILHDDISSTS